MRTSFIWFVFVVLITSIFSCVHDPLFIPLVPPSGLVYSPDSLAVQVGRAVSSIQPTLSGTGPFTFNLNTSPISGENITIDEKGIIIISSDLPAGKYLVSIVVTNAFGSVSFSDIYKIRAFNSFTPPAQLAYAPSSANILAGTSYTSTVPSLQGTSPFTFSIISNPAPEKISINNQGIVTTTPDLASGSYALNIQVTNSLGSATFNAALTINVSNTASPPSGLTYSTNTLTISLGGTGTSVIPDLSGTSPFIFSLSSSPNAAADITINSSGVITTNSSLAADTYVISVMVTNSAGTANFPNIYTITVNAIKAVTFANDIEPLITQNCAPCHTVGLYTIYTNYTNTSTDINLILNRVQRKPDAAGFMPKNGSALTSSQIQLLIDWFAQGLSQ